MLVDQKVNKGAALLTGELILITIMCEIFSYTMEVRRRQKSGTQDLRGITECFYAQWKSKWANAAVSLIMTEK